MDVPEHLIELQKAADLEHAKLATLDGEERQEQWEAWRMCAEAVQAAVTQHAADHGESRYEVESAVKKAARHPEA